MAPTPGRQVGSSIPASILDETRAGPRSSPRLQARRTSMSRALQESSEPQTQEQGNSRANTSSSYAGPSDPKLVPQRSSLRRAIRNSVKETNIEGADLTRFIGQAPLTVSQPTKSLKRANRPKPLSLLPQRSSLRRALRESRQLDVESPHKDDNSKPNSSGEGTTFNSDQSISSTYASGPIQKARIPLPLATPPPDSHLDDNFSSPTVTSRVNLMSHNAGLPITPISPIADISSSAIAPFRPEAAIESQKKLQTRPETKKAPDIGRLQHSSTSELDSKSRKKSDHLSGLSRDIAQLQGPELGQPTATGQNLPCSSKPRSSRLDADTETERRGWHRVRQVVTDAPNGLYLVEWEGRDPRTGVMWPETWVKSRDVSASAIQEWKERKRQILLEYGEAGEA